MARWTSCRRLAPLVSGVAAISVVASALLPPTPAWGAAAPPRLVRESLRTEIVVTPGRLGTISKYLFGANLLWADNAEGAFDNAQGRFYPGFVRLLKNLGVSALRYPGGTTSDSFHWQRAIGPQAGRRPNEPYGMQSAVLSGACCVLDGPTASSVGPDELGHLLGQTGAAGTITVNFATGTAQQAADFVAYMTAPDPAHPSHNPAQVSYWAALRARHGHRAPYNVPYWEVGNEQFFPGQFGWRSGDLVSLGPHAVPCPPGEVPECLYAFGGTTAFWQQDVGRFADERPSASYSDGAPNQRFYVYFPPVVPHSLTVYVGGQPWSQLRSLATAGPAARAYELDPTSGAITFGNGAHGLVPPRGALVTVSYESGPHAGFVEFYRAMKAVDRHISICESEGPDLAFLQLMGRRYPYDCVQLHEYARPPDVEEPLARYEQDLMSYPPREGAQLAALQGEIRRWSGREVPVFITEYGQLVAPVPAADPQFNLSLDEGLLIGAQLTEWADHGVRVAEKYLADSAPFSSARVTTAASVRPLTYRGVLGMDKALVGTGLSIESAMVAHRGGDFVAEPTGLMIGLMSRLGGMQRLRAYTVHAPVMGAGDHRAPVLWVTAAASRSGSTYLFVVNASPLGAVTTRVVLDGRPQPMWARYTLLDGPSPTAYNTIETPRAVGTVTGERELGGGSFDWTFPAHSATLLVLPRSGHVRSGPGRPHLVPRRRTEASAQSKEPLTSPRRKKRWVARNSTRGAPREIR